MKTNDFQHKWSLYFSLTASDAPKHDLVKLVFAKLVKKIGEGSLKEIPHPNYDGNPRDGFRRPINLEGHIEGKWHFRVWTATEWQNEPKLEARFEFPIDIQSNLPWNEDKEIWSWLAKILSKLGYEDRMFTTYSIRDLIKRLEKEELSNEVEFYKKQQQ